MLMLGQVEPIHPSYTPSFTILSPSQYNFDKEDATLIKSSYLIKLIKFKIKYEKF